MNVNDYDHDGRPTEFVVQTGAPACSHHPSVLVGLSRTRPALHVLGTVAHPDRPLTLEHLDDWDKLLHSTGSVAVVQVACGDHGSSEETEVELRTDGQGIHANRVRYACDADGKRGPLRSREPF